MTQQTSMTMPDIEEQNERRCCHHWVIQPASGPVSQGTCQVCGEVKEFKNYVEAATWGDDRLSSRSGAAKPVVTRTSADSLGEEYEE